MTLEMGGFPFSYEEIVALCRANLAESEILHGCLDMFDVPSVRISSLFDQYFGKNRQKTDINL